MFGNEIDNDKKIKIKMREMTIKGTMELEKNVTKVNYLSFYRKSI
jgi:hypothetical protein